MNNAEAARIVAVVIAACPSQGSKLDREQVRAMINVYESLLDDLTYEQVNRAVRVLLQTRTWMPSIADIRATALEIDRGPATAGGEAWGEVLRCIGRYGSYRRPGTDFEFHDPVTAQCVSALAWSNLCLSENAVADRARFIELYGQLGERSRRHRLAPGLTQPKQPAIEDGTGRGVLESLSARLAGKLGTGS